MPGHRAGQKGGKIMEKYYKFFYSGEQDQEAIKFRRETGWKVIWGSDAQGLNGDTWIVYRSIEDLPKGLQEYAAAQEKLSIKKEKTMKVREVIRLLGWTDGSGFSWNETYSDEIIEIKESWLPKNANDLDWSWYDTPENNPEERGVDTKIIVEFYAEDADPDYDEPLAKVSKWESDLWIERNFD